MTFGSWNELLTRVGAKQAPQFQARIAQERALSPFRGRGPNDSKVRGLYRRYQSGDSSSAFVAVIRSCAVPSRRMEKMSESPSLSDTKMILFPFGEKRGDCS